MVDNQARDFDGKGMGDERPTGDLLVGRNALGVRRKNKIVTGELLRGRGSPGQEDYTTRPRWNYCWPFDSPVWLSHG